jgi:hypothetical protein
MNENQQELLNYIYQHNLNPEDALRFVRDFDVPQEDKVAVLESYQKKQQEDLAKAQAEKQREMQEGIDQGLRDMRAARDRYEQASKKLDETGALEFFNYETSIMNAPLAWMRTLSPQRQFEAAKAAQAKAATDLQQKFYEAGREDLADALGLPKSKFSRRVYTELNATANSMLFDIWATLSDNEFAEQQEKFYGDVSAGIGMETQKTAGEIVSEMGSSLANLDLAEFASLAVDLGEEGSMMLAQQAPYIALTTVPYIGLPLNFAARASQAYQDVEDDPNLTSSQKIIHSFWSGGVESVGDVLIGKAGALGASLVSSGATKIGSKLLGNSLTRGASKVGGVIVGEGTSESIQELLIMGSEKFVLGREEENPLNRLYESFVGGALVGGPLSGARMIVEPSPSQLASRPGDPSHPLATEIGEKIDSIIAQAENVEPGSTEAKALETQLEDLLQQEKDRVGKASDYYKKMRRRDRASYDRVLELDSEIGRVILRSKGLKTDWAKETSKKELEALMAERNKLYEGFEAKSKAPLSTLEQFEDAVNDIDIAIAEIDTDLESIDGLVPEGDADLKLINDLNTRKSALRNKKKSLQKALGELQAAESSGDIDAIAEAYKNLQVAIDQKLPSTEASVDQTNDDIEQDTAEAPTQPETEAEPAAEPVAEPVSEPAKPKQKPGRQPLVFSRENNVTDEDIESLPTQLVRPIRNLLNGLKLPVRVIVHEDLKDLQAAHPLKSKKSQAFYNPKTKEVHVHKGSSVAVLRHEFIHAMIHDLLGDAKYRGRILNQIKDFIGVDNYNKLVDQIEKNYTNEKGDKPSQRVIDEEVVTRFMEEYATPDGINRLRKRGFVQRLKDFFNDLFNKKYGRYADQYFINTDSDLMAVMQAFVAGTEVGSEINVQTQAEADAQTSAMDSVSRAYPDLKDKVVTFRIVFPDKFGSITKFAQERSVKVNDYWHWRNYWAFQTGNGRNNYIVGATYRGDDGSIKTITTPNPKKGRDGEVLDMEPKLFSWAERETRSFYAYTKASSDITLERKSFSAREADAAQKNMPLDQATAERIQQLDQALADLNELLYRKDPNISKYEKIREQVMESSTSTQAEGAEARGTEFLQSISPNNTAKFEDEVDPDMILDKVDDSDGIELTHPDNIEVKDMSEHVGRPMILIQYDKTEGTSGVSYEGIADAVSSHSSRDHATKMKTAVLNAARKYAEQNPDQEDITVIVGFGIQGDSVLSNPRAIDAITVRFESISETDQGGVLGALASSVRSMVTSDLGNKDFSNEVKGLIDAVVKTYGGHDATDLEGTVPFFTVEKDGVQYAFPDFEYFGKQQFIDFMNGMKKEGEAAQDTSIRKNGAIISKLFTKEVARELGLSAEDIKTQLTSENLKGVPTADIVSYREIYFETKKDASGKSVLATGLKIQKVEGRPFPFAVTSVAGSSYYGLPKSIQFVRAAAKAKVKEKNATIEDIDRQITEMESGQKQVDVIIRESGKRDVRMSPLDTEREIKAVETELADALKSGDTVRVEEAKARIKILANALKDQAKRQKEEISKLRQAISGKAQGIVELNLDESTVLNSVEDLDSVMDNSWAPRERSALQQQFDWIRLKFQDKFAPIMMMQEDIEAARGTRVEDDQNFKRAEELMYGKAHNDLEKLEGKVQDLKKSFVDGKVDSGMLTDYMYARHAAERNAMLKDRDGVENGSGMTDQEAADILSSFTKEQIAALEKSAAIVDEISQDTRDTMRKFGLESDARIDSFEKMFKHYVPLGGLATDSKDVDNYPYPTGGVGFHVKGSTTKKAKGRKTIADNIVAQVIQQNGAVKIKARRNEALQSLFNLVSKNPNTKLWNTSDNIPVSDPDRAVGVRINGEQKFIIFKDSSLAKNLKGMGVQKLDALSKLMAVPANFLRSAFTTRNPEFIISNFSRDILSAIPNAIAEADLPDGAIKDKHAVARKIITRTPQTLKALIKGEVMGKGLDAVTAKYLSEFKEDGGQTGWGFIKPLQDIAADLNNETSEKNKAKKAIKWMEKNSLQHIENINDAFENSIRLSAYIEAREAGASRADAAQLAKNITVNFNKSGEWGAVANAYYLFFNASIQGTARIARSLVKMKQVENPDGSISKQLSGPQRIVIGLGLVSGMLAMINMALSDEDEDGELFYNKIPDYEKERNLIMMYDGKNYIKIPLPYGYNLFSNMGTAIAETMAGQRDADDALWFVANSALSSFSPISFGQSENFAKYIAKGLAPTTIKPLIEMAVNETYFGSKVYREQFPVGAKKPESELAFRSPEFFKDFFQWMNSATGGSQMVSGSFDVNPDLFWYPFEYYIGGLGQFTMRGVTGAYNIKEMIRTGEKVKMEANEIPFLRKVYGEPSKYYDFDLYDDNKEQVQQLYKERKEADDKSIDRYQGIVKLNNKLKSIEKKLKVLRKERRAAQDLPYIERVNRSAELQEKERILIMEYNALHEKLRGN